MRTGTADANRIEPIDAWRADHLSFKRLLDLLEQEVVVFHAGEEPDYPLMLDILHYLRDYLDLSHHPREEVAFGRLAQRDPELKGLLAQRTQEHRRIAVAADQLIRYLDEVIDDALIPRTDLEQAAASYIVSYRQHLAAEEELVLPRAAQLLTPEDWAAMATVAPNAIDPMCGDGLDTRYQELRRAGARHQDRAAAV
jgi:hemerythrin-like domain-containing protein